MNVFILNTGRCGSTTFVKACSHINNYSYGHESLTTKTQDQRLAYPDNHIEADNRLSWFLGRLDEKYGDDAFYVHLTRELEATINSFTKRSSYGIMRAYKEGILLDDSVLTDNKNIARDYIQTVTANIQFFLKDKTKKMEFQLENAQQDFVTFFQAVNAEGDLQLALNEWGTAHNASID